MQCSVLCLRRCEGWDIKMARYEEVKWPHYTNYRVTLGEWHVRCRLQTAPATSPIIVTAVARLRTSLGDIGSDHHHYRHYRHYHHDQQPLYQGQHLLGSGVCHTIKQLQARVWTSWSFEASSPAPLPRLAGWWWEDKQIFLKTFRNS